MTPASVYNHIHLIKNVSNCVVLKNNETGEIAHSYTENKPYAASPDLYSRIYSNEYSFVEEYYTYHNKENFNVIFERKPPNLFINRKDIITNIFDNEFIRNHCDFEWNYLGISDEYRKKYIFNFLLVSYNKCVDVLITRRHGNMIESFFVRDNKEQIIDEIGVYHTMNL